MFEKNKEKMKEKMEPDKVLRFAIVAVILLFLIGALIIGTRMMNPRVDATEGVKKLTELEDANVQKIDAKIQELEQTEADEAAAWKAKSAKEKMDAWVSKYGDEIECCVAGNDAMALGALQAIQSAGRTVGTDIYLVGVDALSEALEDVLAGTMTGTVFNDHFSQSHSAADAAINYITGAGNDHYIGCDYVKVTKDNAQDVLDMVK